MSLHHQLLQSESYSTQDIVIFMTDVIPYYTLIASGKPSNSLHLYVLFNFVGELTQIMVSSSKSKHATISAEFNVTNGHSHVLT